MIRDILDRWSRRTRNVRFVQIGSSDGLDGDPIREFIVRDRWSGGLIEPLPHLYEQLIANYEGVPNLWFENVAVSHAEGSRAFWYISPEARVPGWCNQLGSFDRDVVLSHRTQVDKLADHLLQRPVSCVRLDTLLRKHPMPWIDLVHVDAEGYDFEAIKQIDLRRVKPSIVLYEHKHLPARTREQCLEYLHGHGYETVEDGPDSLAIGPLSRRSDAALCDAVRRQEQRRPLPCAG
jgi:FkbM family methyltransferase